MCGIAGYWSPQGEADVSIAELMALQIRTRGPDDAGTWINESAGLALAHRRLSIVDLSPAGHQPMVSPCGRYVLTFNGEIYNHNELRADLNAEGGHFDWRGHSDTETLLAGLRHWGIEAALQRLNGMFAFALWDTQERTLFIARDRMGEKPLYYGCSGDVFLFGSELKALAVHPGWRGEIDRRALTLYLRYKYIPAPRSIYVGIAKLPPAHYVVVREDGRSVGEPVCYWDLASVAEKGVAQANGDAAVLTDELDHLLRDAVARRMAADVPLGAFLSGGYDSTIVTALMQSQSPQPVKTFSIGFNEQAYNEAEHAKAVADYLGTDHTELYVTPEQALSVVPKLPFIYDEPFSDSSQIPTYLVSQLARRSVTVSLSGDGGDELFYGYDRYFKALRLQSWLVRVPAIWRHIASRLARSLPAGTLEILMGILPRRLQANHLTDRLPGFAAILADPLGEGFYKDLISHWKKPDRIVIGADEPDTLWNHPDQMPVLPGLEERMMYIDMKTYLPDDILTKVDRASMAVSLEARVPLLDHRLVEFAWRVPTAHKNCDGQAKWLLRQVLYRYLPKRLMDRPKMGFGVPIDQWLQGPLREWAEALVDEKRLCDEGFFDPAPIRMMWDEHTTGKRRWHYYLWDVLMFQAWLESTT